ncbi:MAG: 30S ribosome-binding factor RbfA [Planctomycetota bacterium]
MTPVPYDASDRGRLGQLESTIMRELQAQLARGLADPRIRGLITVTGVQINKETREARIAVTVLPEEHEQLTLHGLNSAARHLRRRVADRIRTRDMPTFAFAVDAVFKREAATLRAIAEANAEAGAQPGEEIDGDHAATPDTLDNTGSGEAGTRETSE